jgi:hypothetical protein
MNVWIERWAPYLLAILVSAGYYLFFRQYQLPASIKGLYTTIVTICAVSIGFMATSKSILFSIHDREIIKWIKGAGLYNTMIDYMMTSVHWCFFFSPY